MCETHRTTLRYLIGGRASGGSLPLQREQRRYTVQRGLMEAGAKLHCGCF